MSEASDLLENGQFWEAIRSALETGFGTWAYIFILSGLIIGIYIKTESLALSGLAGLIGLLGFSLLINIFTQPLIFLVIVVFIALVLFDVFIKGGKQ